MKTERILTLLQEIAEETSNECRDIASYVMRDELLGNRNRFSGYLREDEIGFKAILFDKLRNELKGAFNGMPQGRVNSVTLELSVTKKSLPILRSHPDRNGFPNAKIDLAISDDNPWRDLEKQKDMILVEIKNPTAINNDGVLTEKDEIKGIEEDMEKLNRIKALLKDKVTTVMIVAYIGIKSGLNEEKVLKVNLPRVTKVDHFFIY